jgi:hypothetical protein
MKFSVPAQYRAPYKPIYTHIKPVSLYRICARGQAP